MTDWPKPSVYVPFFRRFTNERQREWNETRALYDQVLARHQAFTVTPGDIGARVYDYFQHYAPTPLLPPLSQTLDTIIRGERFIFDMPAADFESLNLKEFADFRNFLRRKEYFFENEAKILQLLHEALVRVFCAIAEVLPQAEDPTPFTIPLIHALPEPKAMVTNLFLTIGEEQYRDRGLFQDLLQRLYFNLCEASGREPGVESKKPYKHASDSDLGLDALSNQYLGGTPFRALFRTPVPLKLTHEDRFSHMHIVGGTGAGKTTLLENLILHDLYADEAPGLVIVDSQGDLIRKLSMLDCPGRERFILVSPKDIHHPPALNIFDMNRSRLEDYDEVVKEQVVAGVIQTFDYLFAGLLGADLTAKQGVFFKYVARLMLALPETMGRNATILDMMQLMENPLPYRKAIEALPPIQRSFFERDFPSKTFVQTKEQIRYRLQAIIENPTIARLFTQPETKLDLFAEMNRGSVILVDTAKDFLKGASGHFGRIFISLVLQAVLERAAISERDRRPVFLIVDEAAAYFDSNIDDLLTEARKYKCGCVFAHQYLDQTTPSLRASLAANTAIKMASGVSTGDARALAADMRTTADFILSQPRLNFASYIRNVTPQAVSIPVRQGLFARTPRLSDGEYQEFVEGNRARVSLPSIQQSTPEMAPAFELDPDISPTW